MLVKVFRSTQPHIYYSIEFIPVLSHKVRFVTYNYTYVANENTYHEGVIQDVLWNDDLRAREILMKTLPVSSVKVELVPTYVISKLVDVLEYVAGSDNTFKIREYVINNCPSNNPLVITDDKSGGEFLRLFTNTYNNITQFTIAINKKNSSNNNNTQTISNSNKQYNYIYYNFFINDFHILYKYLKHLSEYTYTYQITDALKQSTQSNIINDDEFLQTLNTFKVALSGISTVLHQVNEKVDKLTSEVERVRKRVKKLEDKITSKDTTTILPDEHKNIKEKEDTSTSSTEVIPSSSPLVSEQELDNNNEQNIAAVLSEELSQHVDNLNKELSNKSPEEIQNFFPEYNISIIRDILTPYESTYDVIRTRPYDIYNKDNNNIPSDPKEIFETFGAYILIHRLLMHYLNQNNIILKSNDVFYHFIRYLIENKIAPQFLSHYYTYFINNRITDQQIQHFLQSNPEYNTNPDSLFTKNSNNPISILKLSILLQQNTLFYSNYVFKYVAEHLQEFQQTHLNLKDIFKSLFNEFITYYKLVIFNNNQELINTLFKNNIITNTFTTQYINIDDFDIALNNIDELYDKIFTPYISNIEQLKQATAFEYSNIMYQILDAHYFIIYNKQKSAAINRQLLTYIIKSNNLSISINIDEFYNNLIKSINSKSYIDKITNILTNEEFKNNLTTQLHSLFINHLNSLLSSTSQQDNNNTINTILSNTPDIVYIQLINDIKQFKSDKFNIDTEAIISYINKILPYRPSVDEILSIISFIFGTLTAAELLPIFNKYSQYTNINLNQLLKILPNISDKIHNEIIKLPSLYKSNPKYIPIKIYNIASQTINDMLLFDKSIQKLFKDVSILLYGIIK